MFGWLIRLILSFLDIVRQVVTAVAGENAGKLIDWLSWRISGKHKIQRIASTYKGLQKMKLLEWCLANSRSEAFRSYKDYIEIGELSAAIRNVKDIKSSKDPEFYARLNATFHPMCEINRLTKDAFVLRKTKYDTEDEEHEMSLLSLWNCLQPNKDLDNRISKMWGDIGFQGTDPATDFRGMGLLGLENLIYLAKHKKTSQKLLSASNHPQYGFSLAITSINLTAVMVNMLEKGYLRYHFYYKCSHGGARNLSISDLHEVHCSILNDFIEYYQAQKPASIMEFNTHKAAYAELLKIRLLSDKPYLEPVQ